jgi:membrane protease YdiL (CAAX protease family)
LKLDKKPFLFSIIIAVLIIFIANPLINFTGELNAKLSLPESLSKLENWMKSTEESLAQLTKLYLKTESIGGLMFNLFMIALIPAIGEEFLFRGVIQRILSEWTKNNHLAIWLSAILFSALHFQFYGFLPRAILGAMFGYLFVISGNLWLPMIAHFINNAAAVVAYYLYGEGILNVDPEKIGINSKYQTTVIISSIMLIALYLIFKKYETFKKLKAEG